jgi:hypothetical protein
MDWKSSPCSNVDQREQVSYSTLFELEPLDIGVAFVCFIAGFMLYVRTLAPFLLRGDSAEFQTLAYTLGITHPTGYAIYLLFAKMFITLLPIGSRP